MQVREKVGKSRLSVLFQYFPMICGSGGSKRRPVKAAGAEPCCQMRDEKLHVVVARSTFPSKNVQFTSASGLFVKLRCWKSVCRCGAKHISKWKCTKHASFGALLEVELSKKCTPLWREAHVQLKMYKAHHDQFWKLRCRKSARRCGAKHMSKWKCTKHLSIGALFEVAMSKKCTPLWREAHFQVKMYKAHHDQFWKLRCRKSARRCGASTFPSENVQNTSASEHFSKLRCRKGARRCGAKHIAKPKCTKHIKTHHDQFWKLRCRKVHAVVARSTFPNQNAQKATCTDHFLTVEMLFRVAGARDYAPCEKWAKRAVL